MCLLEPASPIDFPSLYPVVTRDDSYRRNVRLSAPMTLYTEFPIGYTIATGPAFESMFEFKSGGGGRRERSRTFRCAEFFGILSRLSILRPEVLYTEIYKKVPGYYFRMHPRVRWNDQNGSDVVVTGCDE